MKLGISGVLPRALDAIDVAAVRKVRELGFVGSQFLVDNPPSEISRERAREIASICEGEGVALVEFGHYRTQLVSADPGARAASIQSLGIALRVARWLGGPPVAIGAGSLNPDGHWFPHADNYKLATLERLINSLRETAKMAEQEGVILALECHVSTALKDARTSRDVVDAVGSPALKVHMDPVNWMTFDRAFESGPAVAEMFATLGADRLSGGVHSKGLAVENRFVAHLSETFTGADNDVMDHAAVLRHVAALPGERDVVLEHLPVESVPRAREHLLRVAEQIDVRFSS